MTATFALTEDEFITAQRLFRSKSSSQWAKVWHKSAIALGAILLVGGFVGLVVDGRPISTVGGVVWHSPSKMWMVLPFVGLVLLSIYWIGPDTSASRAFVLEHKSTAPATWSVFADGLRVESQTVRADMLWSAFQWHTESESLMVIALSKKRFAVLPKRAFSQSDLLEFRALLKKRVAERK